ncbi:MAG: acyltransferase [Thermodesulfobacteriota bacterium]|nr:acyltransferase [Thermodesulfobacteriota bacterium]
MGFSVNLEQAMKSSRRDNNFNLMRIIAAWLVLVTHSYGLLGLKSHEPLVRCGSNIPLGYLGLHMFFIISGFLISMSYHRRRTALAFIEARLLRIFPGLFFALLFCIFVIGPIVTSYPLAEYYSDKTWLKFFFLNQFCIDYFRDLPGVFISNPYPRAVNGSLWTLPLEMRMYLVVFLLGIIGVASRKRIFNLLFAGYCLGIISSYYFYFAKFPAHFFLATSFMVGIFFYRNRIYMPINTGLMLVFSSLSIVTAFIGPLGIFFPFVYSYVIFWIAYVPKGMILRYNNIGDFSYGVYIYAFPVQQFLIYKFAGLSVSWLIFGASLIVLPLAMTSWYFVEKRALGMKGRVFAKVWKQQPVFPGNGK